MKHRRRPPPPAVPHDAPAGEPIPPAPFPVSKAARIALPCLLVVGAAVAYLPVLRAQFLNFDDTTQVVTNEHVNTGLSAANVAWAFSHAFASNYIPLTWISHMVCCQVFGLIPAPHHIVNLLLHLCNVALFWALLRRIPLTPIGALVGAGLFALHPIHVESVAWIAERKDVLNSFFGLVACHAYFSWARKSGTARYLAALAAFALSLLAKPMLVTLPFALLLLDFWPLGRAKIFAPQQSDGLPQDPAPPDAARSGADAALELHSAPARTWPQLLVEKLPWFGLAIVFCAITMWSQTSGGAVTSVARYPLAFRLANAATATVVYLRKLFLPLGLPVFEPLQPTRLLSAPVMSALALLLGLTAIAVGQSRRRPWFAVGWLWYLGTLIPVIGLVQVGAQAWAYRYTYIPFLGLYLVAAAALDEFLRPNPARGRILAIPIAATLAVLALLTWRQAERWHDNESLFRYTLQHTTRNWVAAGNLGVHLAANARYAEARGYLETALAIEPSHFQAANALGFTLDHLGQTAEAVVAYRKAMALRPTDASTQVNLITLLLRQKKFAEAFEVDDTLLTLDPFEGHLNRGAIDLGSGKPQDALVEFHKAEQIDPSSDAVRYYFGLAYRQAGQLTNAVAALDRPLKLDSTQRLNRFLTLGTSLRDLQQYQRGAETLRLGLAEFPHSIELLEQLAQLEYSLLKDQTNALHHLQLILQLEPNHPQREQFLVVIKYLTNQTSVPSKPNNP